MGKSLISQRSVASVYCLEKHVLHLNFVIVINLIAEKALPGEKLQVGCQRMFTTSV